MLNNYIPRLVHTAQLQETSPGLYGGTEVTSISTISCYLFSATNERSSTPVEYSKTLQHVVLLPLATIAKVNDLIVNIVDKDDITILTIGKITKLVKHRHKTEGIREVAAILEVS